ncbi:MAG: hypothetical protein SFY96_00975 [Planctomycetota bacterium]|nr:hypothetical protein [Planctomycetota bacterium]
MMTVQATPATTRFHAVRRVAAMTACLIGSLASFAALGGCYEHVVSAKGVGTEGMTIHERQMSNTWIDRQLFGDADPKRTP